MKNTFKISKKTGSNFAIKSGDRNPLHIDKIYAHNSMFGENICHGVLVFLHFLRLNKLLIDNNLLNINIKFLNPVYYEKKIHIKKINKYNYILFQKKIIVLKISINCKDSILNLKNINLKKILKLKQINFFFKNNKKIKTIETLLMHLSAYSGMFYPGKNCLINEISINKINNKSDLNKIKIYSKRINFSYPIIENYLEYGNFKINFETLKRASLKLNFEKPRKNISNRIKNIDKNIMIIGAGSGLGLDMLDLVLKNKKVKIFATYYKNKINFKNKNLNTFKFDINKDLSKINKIIIKHSPMLVYYFVTCKIKLINTIKMKNEFIKYYINFPLKILNKHKKSDINFFYPSTVYIDNKPGLNYSKIKLKAENKLKKFKNVSIARIPEINTKQNLGLLNNDLKNFRYYLNTDLKLQKKTFFIK